MTNTITTARVARLFTLCGRSPAKFSRLSDRLARIAGTDARLWALSRAANEQRHMLLSARSCDTESAARHSRRVGREIQAATVDVRSTRYPERLTWIDASDWSYDHITGRAVHLFTGAEKFVQSDRS